MEAIKEGGSWRDRKVAVEIGMEEIIEEGSSDDLWREKRRETGGGGGGRVGGVCGDTHSLLGATDVISPTAMVLMGSTSYCNKTNRIQCQTINC